MAILNTFIKQPADVQDYDIDFSPWLAAQSDTAVSMFVGVETGLTMGVTSLTAGVVKVWVSGGTDGTKYKITARITTALGRVNEQEIYIKVKEY